MREVRRKVNNGGREGRRGRRDREHVQQRVSVSVVAGGSYFLMSQYIKAIDSNRAQWNATFP